MFKVCNGEDWTKDSKWKIIEKNNKIKKRQEEIKLYLYIKFIICVEIEE
jgi:hypothetical protein